MIDGMPQTDRELLTAILLLHSARAVYTECGHRHTVADDGVLDVPDVGLVCAAGIVYYLCASCCVDENGEQSEQCATEHDHSRDDEALLCPTRGLFP